MPKKKLTEDEKEIRKQVRDFKRSQLMGIDSSAQLQINQQYTGALPVAATSRYQYDSWMSTLLATECIFIAAMIAIKIVFAALHLVPHWLRNPIEDEPRLFSVEDGQLHRYHEPEYT